MIDLSLVPGQTALIVVDLQTCFVRDSPVAAAGGPVVLRRLNQLAAVCRQAGIAVIHTRFVLEPDGSDLGLLGETSPPARAGLLNRDARSAQLDEELDVLDGDLVLDKPRFGAFTRTALGEILRARDVDSVIIGGIATNVCCETTAREALQRDFHVFFLSNGTACADIPGASAAELQKASLATLGFLFGQVLTVDQMIAKILAAVSPG